MIRLPAAVLVVCGALPASAVGELPPLFVMTRAAAEAGDAGAQISMSPINVCSVTCRVAEPGPR